MLRAYALRIIIGSTLLIAVGCSKSNKLETGYTYRPLGASQAEIRGFYAERFSPEARAAALERDEERERRRPTPGY